MRLSVRTYTTPDMAGLALRASPLYASLSAVLRFIGSLLPTLNIFVTAAFVNTALAVVNGQTERAAIYGPIALIMIMTAYQVLSGALSEMINGRWAIVLRRRLRPLMVARIARLEYKHIEHTETADLIQRVAPIFDTQVREMFNRILDVADTAVFIAGIMITLFTQVWWVALCLLAVSAPLMLVATRAGRRSYDADKEMTKIDRRVDYTSGVLKSREAADERTLYGYSGQLNAQYAERYHYARKFRLKVNFSNFVKNKMGGVVCSLVAIFTMLALLGPVVAGNMDYGMFIGLIGGVVSLSGRLSWGVNWVVQDLAKRREYLKDLTAFLALSSVPDATDCPADRMEFKRIVFKNVSFKYPGTEAYILRGLSFVIENGRHYAFVGVNGAGKTTITKLITGLYVNYEGEILVDGRELRTFSQAELKALTSVVYQDFARYFLTLYENISVAMPYAAACSDEHENASSHTGAAIREQKQAQAQKQRKQVTDAVALVDLTGAVDKLANGLDTQLGKVHESGVDLSGGEWQRVAMARSVVNPAPLRILDEPTAALDPISESRVYHHFEEISRGRTTLFISHRLGSTKLADVIYVLADGAVAETGTHAALMAQKGLYAGMYDAQAQWYQNDEQIQSFQANYSQAPYYQNTAPETEAARV